MAHAHDASENNPTKEIIHALIGVVLLLVIIGGIAVFAWLRPAGNHEPATVSATPAGRALDEFAQKEANPTDAQKAQAVAEATAPDATADTPASPASEQEAAAQVADSNGDAQTPVQDKAVEDKPVASDVATSDAPHDTTAEDKAADNTATAEAEPKAEKTAN
ncbi:hypothetical protein [Moraxella bovis]|uniref:Uncharacterized protein n=1 Tax=Moraxella bovis TaxID=476 RepID=A0A378PR03_MORBO|nr:hypothetical protein [Moraxella bovis]STY90383.1 Uncharacterised protein [Moraxella bovis]